MPTTDNLPNLKALILYEHELTNINDQRKKFLIPLFNSLAEVVELQASLDGTEASAKPFISQAREITFRFNLDLARNNDADACLATAHNYILGVGCEKDASEARKWLEKADQLGIDYFKASTTRLLISYEISPSGACGGGCSSRSYRPQF
jgi:TPR repeat protein